jgi:Autophagy protein Apg5
MTTIQSSSQQQSSTRTTLALNDDSDNDNNVDSATITGTTTGTTSTSVSIETIQQSNWYGSVPVRLSIARTSIGVVPPTIVQSAETTTTTTTQSSTKSFQEQQDTSSLSPLLVQYCMVPRFSFLHLSLQHSIQYLYQYTTTYNQQKQQEEHQQVEEPLTFDASKVVANSVDSIDNRTIENSENTDNIDSYNDGDQIQVNTSTSDNEKVTKSDSKPTGQQQQPIICWFEDEETGTPLRWHLFVGIIYDLLVSQKQQQQQSTATISSTINTKIPWKILVHFTTSNYPTNVLLPLPQQQQQQQQTIPVGVVVSIQQQLRYYYQHSIKQSLTIQYNTSNVALNITKESHTKLWYSILQNNYTLFRSAANDYCNFNTLITQIQQQQSNNTNINTNNNVIHRIPIRIYIDSKPPIQPSVRTSISYTLGSALAEWIPMFFESYTTGSLESDDTTINTTTGSTCTINKNKSFRPRYSCIIWKVCGLYKPSLTINLFDLWKYLCYPDHFLYIVIVTSTQNSIDK